MAIHIENRRQAPRLKTTRIRELAQVIVKEGLALPRAELSIVLTDDATIHELNRTWRGKDKATDVLSFSQVEGEEFGAQNTVLGDVIVSMDTAARQAEKYGWSLDEEMKRLLVHGILHLLGHDHVHGGHQARRMKLEETRLLKLLRKKAPLRRAQ